MESKIRLQKFLAQAGLASRRQAENLITAGKIKVNGQVINQLGTVVNPETDEIEYQGKKITINTKKIYLALNKPSGLPVSSNNSREKSAVKLVRSQSTLYPIGRLDKDSSGLVILTSDGDLANQMTHLSYGIEQEYFLMLDQELRPEDIKKITKKVPGVKIKEVKHQSVKIIATQATSRQLKKAFGQLNYTINKLKVVRVGKLELKTLPVSEWKTITKDDIL